MKIIKNHYLFLSLLCLTLIIAFLYIDKGVTWQKELDNSSPELRNNIHFKLGTELKQSVNLDQNDIYIALINNEHISQNEWQYNKTFEVMKSKERNWSAPNNETIFNEIVERKLIVDKAKQTGLYPNKDEIDKFIKEQKILMKSNQDIQSLLNGWMITEAEYINFMQEIWADSIAIEKWYDNIIIPQINTTLLEDLNAYEEEYTRITNLELSKLKDNAKIIITDEGNDLGILYK
ncbi:MAG: hypothetical protein GX333_05195 [Syntrophomonadaceae bacterium]|nr:hypothetical protein [Syntrophomonadaceae bacterium]